jgi:hypothetical protein
MPEMPFLGWPRPLHPRTHPLRLPIPREATEPSPQSTQRKHMKNPSVFLFFASMYSVPSVVNRLAIRARTAPRAGLPRCPLSSPATRA